MEMPKLPLEKRLKSFDEVELGFTEEQAMEEANRCLQCQNPQCVEGCPARVDVPKFIKEFREGDTEKAVETIREKNFFPSICGRICQHERQCEGSCILAKADKPICIGGLERYVGDHSKRTNKPKNADGKKAAVIGSGPSGLTAAAVLAEAGVEVTVFELSNSFGGVIKYGVPNFRLPKETVVKELNGLNDLGIDFEPNAKVAVDSLEKVAKEFDAVFIGTGAGKPKKLTLPGSELKGISSAMKFLVNLNQSEIPLIKEGEKLVVVGGGYVGIDAARSAVRLGAKVTVITVAEREEAMKSISIKDFAEAEEEGVEFKFGYKVKGFEGDEKVERVLYSNAGEGFLEADKVIYAIGQTHEEDKFKKELMDKKEKHVIVDEKHKTKMPNVFAAGDCVHGPKTVIHAVAAGRDAAKAMLAMMGVESK